MWPSGGRMAVAGGVEGGQRAGNRAPITPSSYLGVDPGPHGAAAIVARVGASWRLEWSCTWAPGSPAPALPYAPTVAAVEGLYLGKAGHGVLEVAEDAGRWLERLQGLPVHRPLATQWRADVLRLPATTKAADCDRNARALVEQLGLSVTSGHLVDAVCIALWAGGVRGRRAR